jgi:hypothetical protein
LVFLLRGCRASTTPAIRLPAVGYWKVSGTGKVADPGEKTAAAAYGKGVRDPPVITYIWSFWTVRYPRPGQPLAQFASRGNVRRPSALLHAEPLPHSTSSCAASPAVAACRESHRCHLVATLRAEEEPSCRCRRLPQPGAPLRVARAATAHLPRPGPHCRSSAAGSCLSRCRPPRLRAVELAGAEEEAVDEIDLRAMAGAKEYMLNRTGNIP